MGQRTDAWQSARCGRLTGSRAGAMLATVKTGEAAARRDLRTQLVVERLTNTVQDDGFVSKDMQWGTDNESAALAAYEAETGSLLTKVGFISALDVMAGYSPDALVGSDGFVEAKCPRSANHLRYLKATQLPTEHLPQIQHGFWLSGANWCDFVSFDPRMPKHLQLVVIRVERAAVDIDGYAKKALTFLEEVEAETQALMTLGNLAGQLERAVAAHV